MPQDYYEVLGIPRTASSDEVRRAYRRLAKDHHPDVNTGDPAAEARFKSINEAYEVLRDPSKRSAYDRFGHRGVKGFRPGGAGSQYTGFGDLGDIFEQFFGVGAAARPRPRTRAVDGQDLRARLTLEFEEAVFGVTRRVEVSRFETCDECDGTGAAAGSEPVACPTCNGSGEVRAARQTLFGTIVNLTPCPNCRGEGETVSEPCTACDGQGRVRRDRKLDVDIPAGVSDGLQIRLAGEGNHGRLGGRPGDLYVALSVEPHDTFERVGDELHVRLNINPADAALGAEVEVPTLDEPTTLRVPSGTQTGQTFRLRELGVPRLHGTGRGDLVVTTFVMTPDKLSREQRDLLERLRATLPEAEVVGRDNRGWWDRVRERFK
ncbi:MAG: molecular chaperone DnaJ [Anaerolineae bacterium]